MIRRLLALFLASTLIPGTTLAGQALTLAEALARADSAAWPNRMADAQADAEAARAAAPLKGILPSVRTEVGYLRTTDPLNAFGFILRQRAVTPAAFAPSALNDPDPRGNLAAGLVVEQPLFNADAWLARRAATAASDAARARAGWARQGTAMDVVRAYYGAILANEQVRALDAALRAAGEHVRQAELMSAQGLVTRADVLLARVKAGEVESQLVQARGNARLAGRALALSLGDPVDTAFVLPDSLPSAGLVRSLEALLNGDGSTEQRDDLRAARLGVRAAGANAQRAGALLLPRVNAFGRLDWNHPDTPFGGRSAWTFGVMLSWSPWSGGSELAEGRQARSELRAARAMREAAAARAALEVAAADQALATALARVDIAAVSVDQGREAHRIVARKYEGGLATVTELFDAAATETASDLGFSAARYDAITALAQGLTARGQDLTGLAALDSSALSMGVNEP